MGGKEQREGVTVSTVQLLQKSDRYAIQMQQKLLLAIMIGYKVILPVRHSVVSNP